MGVQALHPSPLPHASWRCMCHTSLPMHHVSWPRVSFASPTPKPHGGVEGPWVGPPEHQQLRLPTGGWWGPPVRGTSPRHPPSACRDPLTPPCPPPRLGRRGPRVRYEPAPPIDALYGQCGPPGERRGPALPRAPPPTTAGAKGQPAPGGLLCRGGEATGRFVPAPNGGLYSRPGHRHPLGGSHTATHHSTTATGGRE